MKILLLEDDVLLNKSIVKYLESTGHIVESFRDGQNAFDAICNKDFDLLILDINVPRIDGLTLLEKIYDKKIQPRAIFISALIDIEEISRAFELGCYDYLKKPFHLKELTLRIDKMLQLHQIPQSHTRLSKNYSFDSISSILSFCNEPQKLSNKQLEIIKILSSRRANVVTYDALRDYVWNDFNIDNATIIAEVNRLKKKLKENFIVNIRSIGYMIDNI